MIRNYNPIQEQIMPRLAAILTVSLAALAFVGCAPSPQEVYDDAVKNLERSESRLDALRPAYDAAVTKAKQQVCQEIAGTTTEAQTEAALANIEGLLSGAAKAQTEAAADPQGRPVGDPDAAIDQILSAHKDMAEKTAALTAPLAKANETMKLINTPGTPEAARVDAVLADMPEVKAYRRQEKRVERAQAALDAAEAQLPGAAAAK
jgi:hypothetical protein